MDNLSTSSLGGDNYFRRESLDTGAFVFMKKSALKKYIIVTINTLLYQTETGACLRVKLYIIKLNLT